MASNAMIVVCILILLQAAIQDDVEHPDAIQFFNSDKVETATLLLQLMVYSFLVVWQFYEFVGTATFAWEGMAALAIPLQGSAHKSTRPVFPTLFFWTTGCKCPICCVLYVLLVLSVIHPYCILHAMYATTRYCCDLFIHSG